MYPHFGRAPWRRLGVGGAGSFLSAAVCKEAKSPARTVRRFKGMTPARIAPITQYGAGTRAEAATKTSRLPKLTEPWSESWADSDYKFNPRRLRRNRPNRRLQNPLTEADWLAYGNSCHPTTSRAVHLNSSLPWTARAIHSFCILARELPAVFREDQGGPLFDDKGGNGQYVEGVLKSLQAHQDQHQGTQASVRRLQELDLLDPVQAKLALESGENHLSLFSGSQWESAQPISVGIIRQLFESGALELICTHLQSLAYFRATVDRPPGHHNDRRRSIIRFSGALPATTGQIKSFLEVMVL